MVALNTRRPTLRHGDPERIEADGPQYSTAIRALGHGEEALRAVGLNILVATWALDHGPEY